MDYRKLIAAAASLTLMASAVSCGKTENTDTKTSESKIVVNEEKTTQDNDDDGETADEDKNDSGDKSESKTTAKSDDKKNDTTTTTVKGGAGNTDTAKTTQASGNGSSKTEETSGGSGSGNSGSSSGNTSENTSGGNSTSGGGSSTGGTTGGGASTGGNNTGTTGGNTGGSTQTPTEQESYTAEVKLGSAPSITGENVSANGSVVTVNGGGTFRFSGSVTDGQIFVDTATEEKVKIVLDGVSISNSAGPAILINDAKKCTIELADGTSSTLTDGVKDKVNDGVIFSNDTLKIKGNGSLTITANNAHGIASDDDIIIEGGTYNITSKKSGIFAHDDITIDGGDFVVKGGTNGIKSKGTMNINGGHAVISGGTKEEKSSVYAEGAFNYTGGYIFAAGNQVSVPTTSANPYIVVDLGGSVEAGTNVEMLLEGKQMVAFQPHNNFRCLMMLAPEISSGNSFGTVIGGKSDSFKVSGGQNLFVVK